MSHDSTEHHLEEAQHAGHAIQDNFTRNVAMTMAIIAAALAFVTLMSHRQHNATLQLQIKSNDNLTEASNRWAYYQAKKNRQYMNQGLADMLEVTAPAPGKDEKAQALITKWRSSTDKYQEESQEIEKEARSLTDKAADFERQAHLSHGASNFFDVGHLGIEMALVICALAVLTRKSIFWFVGMGVGVVGLAVALSGFVLPPLLHDSHAEPAKHEEPQPPIHKPEAWHNELRWTPESSWDLPRRS
jgi:hypothetical protein